jgi:hypothetical protein
MCGAPQGIIYKVKQVHYISEDKIKEKFCHGY